MKSKVDVPAAEIASFTQGELEIAQKSQALVESLTLSNPADFEFAGNALREVAIKHDAIDAKRKEFVGALTKVVKDINAFFKPVLDSLKSSEVALKDSLGGYKIRIEDREKEIWDICEQDPSQTEKFIEEAKALTVPEVKGLSIKRVYEGEVVDDSKIPREFMVPNIKKLQEATKGGDPEIPGWSICYSTQVRTARK